MANFNLFFPQLLKFEGGLVCDPADRGGVTNKGITWATFKAYAKPVLALKPSLQNLKNLTDEQASVIYKSLYWDRIRGDQIESQDLANIVFDFTVNAGIAAINLLQEVLNELGADIKVDGLIGDATLSALSKIDQKDVYKNYKQGRINYYKNLVFTNPSYRKFLKGWLSRVNSFPDL